MNLMGAAFAVLLRPSTSYRTGNFGFDWAESPLDQKTFLKRGDENRESPPALQVLRDAPRQPSAAFRISCDRFRILCLRQNAGMLLTGGSVHSAMKSAKHFGRTASPRMIR
jgi:hypothetical protein